MKFAKKSFLTLLIAGACAGIVTARDMNVTSDALNLYDMKVTVNDASRQLRVLLDMDLDRFKVSREREMILTPVLKSKNGLDSLELKPVVIAGRNRWYHYLRDGEIYQGCSIYRADVKGHVTYDEEYAFLPWMESSVLEMRARTANCCDTPQKLIGPAEDGNIPLAEISVTPKNFDVPFLFAPPVDAGPVKKSLEGSAFVTFVVNRTELKPDYMRNPQELQKIINSIEQVRADRDAEISGVHIKGFASPEGSYANNVRLATGRTETLRKYVRDLYRFPDNIVTSSFEPEDWQGLRTYLKDSLDYPIAHRSEIIELIDTPMDPDLRDNTIKARYPQDYAVILKDIYPWLRHSDYAVKYTIKVYTSLADIKRVYGEDPTKLRNVDFFTLAQSYPVGSKEFKEVMMKAAEVYPSDPLICLNAANIEMESGNFDRAQNFLARSGEGPEATYARGVLAARRGNPEEALSYFRLAKEAGVKDAGAAMEKAEAKLKSTNVTYFVETPADK